MPTLLVAGDDPLHPAEISAFYAENIPHCSLAPASTPDVAAEIDAFCERSGLRELAGRPNVQ
jgi:hypothetical protein